MSNTKIILLFNLASKRLNSTQDFVEFQSFVREELDVNTVYSLIDEKIYKQDGPKILEYVLVGLSVITDSQPIVAKVYEYVLKTICTADISEIVKISIINQLSLEINKLSTKHLIKFIKICKKDIESSNKNSIQVWKELMPQMLKIISEENTVRTEGIELSGVDFKEKIIKDICCSKVDVDIILPLALMFRKTQLSKKEHELAINMLCSYFEHMELQEVPPLLQQMLLFCLRGDFLHLFFTIQKYFDYKLINTTNVNDQNGFEICTSKNDVMETKTTVLFLLEDFAKFHASFVNDIVKYIETCIEAPCMVLGPFMLSFLLTMSCCKPYETIIFTLIKKLIVHSLEENETIKVSHWLKLNYTNLYDEFDRFRIFIKSEISNYEKVFKGLVNLGLSFLGTTSCLFKKNIGVVNKIHQLGLLIIVSLVNRRSFITRSVLQNLTNFIAYKPSANQYLKCLHKLCKYQKANVIENITELLRLFKEIPIQLINNVTHAVMPILKISSFLRNNVIMILRKELLSRDFQTRHSAVLGFIDILCSIQLENVTIFSNETSNQDSWPGLFTQIALDQISLDIYSSNNCILEDSSDNNEAICLEILDFLKICFYQNAKIKCSLYRGLIKVVFLNEKLYISVTNLLLDHLSLWCVNFNNKKSLKFEKAITIGKDEKCIIHEPLDELVILAQNLLVKNIIFESNSSHKNNGELKKLLDQLINFYSECNTDEIKNDNESLFDVINNYVVYANVIKQVLCVYQSLIASLINSWTSQDQEKECTEKLLKLFSKYNHIIDAIKTVNNINKKKQIKIKRLASCKYQNFVEPIIHLEFDVIYKFLSLLCTYTRWSTQKTVTLLRQNERLWKLILKLVLKHVTEMNQLLSLDIKPKNLYQNLCKLTRLLYNYFLFDLDKKIKINQYAVELGLECYLKIITLINYYYKNCLDTFFKDSNKDDAIDSSEDQSELFNVLRNIRLHLETVLESNQLNSSGNVDNDEDTMDSSNKIEIYLIKCISVICHSINNSNQKLKNILVWLSTVIEKYSFSTTSSAKEFLILTMKLHSAHHENPSILADTIKYLCNSFGLIKKFSETNESQLKFITDYNKKTLCIELCQCLSSEFNHISSCLSKIKAELSALQKNIKIIYLERIEAKEKAMCHQLILLILVANNLTKTDLPLGQCTELVFILLHQVFSTVNAVTKHFLLRSSYYKLVYKQTLFGKMSQIINELFIPNVSNFIIYDEYNRPLTEKEKESHKLKQYVKRQASYIPKVVIQLELFVYLIIKLGKKCKDRDLMNIKLTASRDFILKIKKAQEILKTQNLKNTNRGKQKKDYSSIQNKSFRSNDSDQPPQKKQKFDTNISVSID
ncbi:Fanconi anemia group I protein-like isoform X2 [Daktulosphaira vitifoliae]|uniref:Fanconi anemia group I protein-like isoform X2 n=1 Tax=Daktulosphaira vitifoliae TaxID=58002 RepID=UPI0021AAA368|nr:Fanconi anemia group I protein-like isoform X2 [Daktulosphaira vitifoliae]